MVGYLRIVVAVPLIVAALIVATGAPASASCVGSPSPSPYAFNGTVLSTGADGRIAEVIAEDGRKVEVRGTPDASAVTTVDRTYQVGARYEFHPVNDSSPYEDNACTATRKLAGPVAADGSAQATTVAGGDDAQSGIGPLIVGGLAALASAAAAVFVLAMVRRRRTLPPRLDGGS
jgi:hypothetical protein